MSLNTFHIERTEPGRTYHEGPTHINGDEKINDRYFTFRTEAGRLAAGVIGNVMFTIDRPAKEVWPVLKDFNRWQREHKHEYSGVIGDLEGKAFHLKIDASQPGPYSYEIVKVIPEYLIVTHQPLPKDGSSGGLPGLGGVSPGFHVFLLNEHEGKTTVTIFMEHAAVAESDDVEEALRPWKKVVDAEWLPKWRSGFIRTIKRIVHEGQ